MDIDFKISNWTNLCINPNISIDFLKKIFGRNKDIFNDNSFEAEYSKNKLISWMKKNPQYSFDNLIYKYI